MTKYKKIHISVIVFLLSVVSSPLFAKWGIDVQEDSMTDEKIKTAFITNNEGHSLKVFANSNGAVYATFRLNSQSADVLSEKLITFRVDKNKPAELMASRKSNPKAFTVEPKWVIWRIIPNADKSTHRNVLNELISGNEVAIRYFLFTGGYKETKFTLKNSLNSIKSVLNDSLARLDELNDLSFEVYRDSLMPCALDYSVKDRCESMVRYCQIKSELMLPVYMKCIKEFNNDLSEMHIKNSPLFRQFKTHNNGN